MSGTRTCSDASVCWRRLVPPVGASVDCAESSGADGDGAWPPAPTAPPATDGGIANRLADGATPLLTAALCTWVTGEPEPVVSPCTIAAVTASATVAGITAKTRRREGRRANTVPRAG